MEAVLKKCCHCKIKLPLNCFYKNKTNKTGLQRAYNTCRNKYYKKNKDKLFSDVTCHCGKCVYR